MLLEESDYHHKTEEEPQAPESTRYLCARCQTTITAKEHYCSINNDSPFQSFLNPSGFYFNVITFSHCESVIPLPGTTQEHSWFPGYDWRILGCSRCNHHIGWQFDSKSKSPPLFFALIDEKITLSP